MLYNIFISKENEKNIPPSREGKGGWVILSAISIFSTHHQAIKSPGKGLIISALSLTESLKQ